MQSFQSVQALTLYRSNMMIPYTRNSASFPMKDFMNLLMEAAGSKRVAAWVGCSMDWEVVAYWLPILMFG